MTVPARAIAGLTVWDRRGTTLLLGIAACESLGLVLRSHDGASLATTANETVEPANHD